MTIPKEDYQAFIDYVEFMLDFNEEVSDEEHELYEKLIKERNCKQKKG